MSYHYINNNFYKIIYINSSFYRLVLDYFYQMINNNKD